MGRDALLRVLDARQRVPTEITKFLSIIILALWDEVFGYVGAVGFESGDDAHDCAEYN